MSYLGALRALLHAEMDRALGPQFWLDRTQPGLPLQSFVRRYSSAASEAVWPRPISKLLQKTFWQNQGNWLTVQVPKVVRLGKKVLKRKDRV